MLLNARVTHQIASRQRSVLELPENLVESKVMSRVARLEQQCSHDNLGLASVLLSQERETEQVQAAARCTVCYV